MMTICAKIVSLTLWINDETWRDVSLRLKEEYSQSVRARIKSQQKFYSLFSERSAFWSLCLSVSLSSTRSVVFVKDRTRREILKRLGENISRREKVWVKFCSHFLVHEFLSRLFIYDDDDDDDDDDDSCCACSTPCSYRQPGGRGQFLSRRYCTHSVWLFSWAWYTLQ